MSDILLSPVIKRVLCDRPNFTFNKNSTNLVKLNRADLGDFDALVLGLFLMAHFKGQLVIPDFGFYGRDVHANLVREGRLIAGVNFLEELPPRLRRSVLLIPEKVGKGTTYEDAETLAKYARRQPGTVEFSDFIREVMA